jgi:hypothetical protein
MAETADSNTANGKSQLLQVDHQDRLVDTAATEETDALLYSVSAGRHGRHIRMRTDGTATAAEAVTGRLQAQHQKQQQLLKGNGINSLAVPLSEIVKLRNSIINREKELLELRQEVTTLKCIERRQQRDLDHYIAEEDKAPRLIKNLREELQSVKVSLSIVERYIVRNNLF